MVQHLSTPQKLRVQVFSNQVHLLLYIVVSNQVHLLLDIVLAWLRLLVLLLIIMYLYSCCDCLFFLASIAKLRA